MRKFILPAAVALVAIAAVPSTAAAEPKPPTYCEIAERILPWECDGASR